MWPCSSLLLLHIIFNPLLLLLPLPLLSRSRHWPLLPGLGPLLHACVRSLSSLSSLSPLSLPLFPSSFVQQQRENFLEARNSLHACERRAHRESGYFSLSPSSSSSSAGKKRAQIPFRLLFFSSSSVEAAAAAAEAIPFLCVVHFLWEDTLHLRSRQERILLLLLSQSFSHYGRCVIARTHTLAHC